MADSPCTACGFGFNGRSFVVYINFYDDRQLIQKRARLCQNCIAEILLPLTENSDSRNERGVWVSAQEQNQWHTDATSEIMDPVALAKERLSTTNTTMSTSTEAAENHSTSSVETVGSPAQSQQHSSSKRSKNWDSNSQTSQPSTSSSENTQKSTSRPRSSQRVPRETKSRDR
jgi:hypothetical protein